MLNYIRADIKRILGRKSHAFSMIFLFFIFFAILFFPNRNAQMTSVAIVANACGAFDWLIIFIGLFELIAVFAEDFRVKTMQVAIGLGISRWQVILCKLLEVVILTVLDCIVVLLIITGVCTMFGVEIRMVVMADAIKTVLIKGVLAMTAYISLTMIVLFVTQSIILSMFVFIIVSTGLISGLYSLISMYGGLSMLENLHLNRLMLSNLIGALHSRFVLGGFDVPAFLGICVYIAAGLLATNKLFAKRELDF